MQVSDNVTNALVKLLEESRILTVDSDRVSNEVLASASSVSCLSYRSYRLNYSGQYSSMIVPQLRGQACQTYPIPTCHSCGNGRRAISTAMAGWDRKKLLRS